MRAFPLFVSMQEATIVIVGGGEAATQKTRLILRSVARIKVMAPTLTAELARYLAGNKITHVPSVLDPSVFRGARLVIISTGCPALDAAASDLAKGMGALVNVVDRPALSTVTMPAIVDRDPVVIAIGTEGTAPVLARQIKTQLETSLEPWLGGFARRLGKMRPQVAQRISAGSRRRFWEWVFSGPRQRYGLVGPNAAMDEITEVLATGEVPADARKPVSIIDPGTGAADLLSLRAVRRLQSADLLIHDMNCSRAILDLARRDAERLGLNPAHEPEAWHVQRGARRASEAAAAGQSVAWVTGMLDLGTSPELHGLAEIIPVASPVSSAVVARAENG